MADGLFGTILITGCEGDIGMSLARIARETKACRCLLGSDVNQSPPPHDFDTRFLFPRIDSPQYFDALSNAIKQHRVDAIVVASEPELRGYFAAGVDREFSGVPVIMASRCAVRFGLDKLKTAHLLQSLALPSPWTSIVADSEPQSLPCILKSRTGWGNKTTSILRTPADVRVAKLERGKDIFQEYVGTADGEYTCGLYRTKAGGVRTIVFRRKLRGGLTVSGVTVCDESIEHVLKTLADALEVQGSINVQLRLTDKGPVVFEINPRFSSTVMFRHRLGFRDFVWSLQESSGFGVDDYQLAPPGIEVHRVSQEVMRIEKDELISASTLTKGQYARD